jgi:hypothetical protein
MALVIPAVDVLARPFLGAEIAVVVEAVADVAA